MGNGSWHLQGAFSVTLLLSLTALAGHALQDGRETPPAPPGQRTDHFGDPLPAGARVRIGSIEDQPSGLVSSVAFSPDGKTLALGTEKGGVQIWEVASGVELWRSPASEVSVTSLAYSRDGKRLGYGDEEGGLRLIEAASGSALLTLDGHEDVVLSVAFSPAGKILASAGEDGAVRVWEEKTGKQILDRPMMEDGIVHSVAFSPDGERLAAAVGDGTARILAAATGKEIRRLEAGEVALRAAVFSPDGRTLATAGGAAPIRLWDPVSGELRRAIEPEEHWVEHLAWSGDGTALAGGSYFDKVRIWDPRTGKALQSVEQDHVRANAIAFSPDGATLAVGHELGAAELLEVASGKPLRHFEFERKAVYSIAFSPDGQILAAAGRDPTVHLYSPETGREIRRLPGHESWVNSIAFSPDGVDLASASHDRTVRIRQVSSGKERQRLELGQTPFSTYTRFHCVLFYSPDGKALITWQGSKLMTRWQIDGEEPRMAWRTIVGRKFDNSVRVRRRPEGSPRSHGVALSPDGALVASPGELNDLSSALLLGGATGKEIARLRAHNAPVISVAISPDGSIIATGGEDNAIRLWELATGRGILWLRGQTSAISSLGFSPGGRLLASGSRDGAVRIWDIRQVRKVAVFRGHTGDVTSVAFSPDGKTLASGSADTTLLLWDIDEANLRQGAGAARVGPKELEKLWTVLAGGDATGAYYGMSRLALDPDRSIPYLRDRLHRFPETVTEDLRALVADLDDDEFSLRAKAHRKLAALGGEALEVLLEELEGKPSPEVRLRVRDLLEKIGPLTTKFPSESLRRRRAIQVLERIGTEEARADLQRIADESKSIREKGWARAAMTRIEKHRDRLQR